MLRKLIKYDLKAMNRYLIIIHVFMLSACVLIRVFLTGRLFAEGVDFNSQKYFLPLVLFFTLFTILISMMAFATHLVIAIRFYKNLFPVKATYPILFRSQADSISYLKPYPEASGESSI